MSDNILNDILSKFMNSLRCSGYDHSYRFQTLKGVLNRSKQIEEEIVNGTRIRYRTKAQIEEHKQNTIGNFPNTWFLKNETTNILKVPCTPNSSLVNSMRQKAGSSRGPDKGITKFVEMGGIPVTLLFPMKEFLTGTKGCQYAQKCYITDTQDCRVTRGIYRIICHTCQERDGKRFVYVGTSGFSVHKRMQEHMQCVRSQQISNALAKHVELFHTNDNAEFVTEVIKGNIKYNLERFIYEAVEIEAIRNDPDIYTMNSRSEWGGKGLPRVQIVQN